MKWNVYYCDNGKITTFNVFDHYRFSEEVAALKQLTNDKVIFSDKVRSIAMYYFWSKCEYEIILSEWTSTNPVEKKIDVYEQLRLNWEPFIDYIWRN